MMKFCRQCGMLSGRKAICEGCERENREFVLVVKTTGGAKRCLRCSSGLQIKRKTKAGEFIGCTNWKVCRKLKKGETR